MSALGVQTLQNTCFFKLVNELYDFTPEAIFAQLSPSLRRMLLLKLPVVDIIKLEDTCVVSGIDMNSVWEKVCHERLDHPLTLDDFPFTRSSFHFEGDWKEQYLAIVSSIILNLIETENDLYTRGADVVHCLLFCYCNFRAYVRPIPHIPFPEYLLLNTERYFELNDSLVSPSDFASFLMTECHYRPKLVYISCSLFFYSPLVKDKESLKVRDTLIDFLSNTRQIVFSTNDEITKYWEPDDDRQWSDQNDFPLVSSYVVGIVMCSKDPQLESILTNKKCSVWMAHQIIDRVCQTVQSNGSLMESFFPEEHLVQNLPYNHLKNLSFSMNISDPEEEMDEYTAQSLASTVEKQTSLESVCLKGWPCDKHITIGSWYDGQDKFNNLFFTLISLFRQPQFRELELEDTSFLLSNFKEILHIFFTVPSFNHQILKLSSVGIFPNIKNPDLHPAQEFSEKKSLHLNNMTVTPLLEELIFKYPLLKMESLALVNVTSTTPSKALQKAADLFCAAKSCQLKTLILKDVVLHHPNPQNVMSVLLQSPNLTYLELEHCDIGPGGLVTTLSQTISGCGQLNVLKIVRNDLGGQSEENFQQLCNAIFSLACISDLSLDVSANKLAVHHFTIVMDAWKSLSSGKKLRELIVSENNLEPGLLALANIAHDVIF